MGGDTPAAVAVRGLTKHDGGQVAVDDLSLRSVACTRAFFAAALVLAPGSSQCAPERRWRCSSATCSRPPSEPVC